MCPKISVQFISVKYRQPHLQYRIFKRSINSKQQHFNSLVYCCLYIDFSGHANTRKLILVGCKVYCVHVGKYMYTAVYPV